MYWILVGVGIAVVGLLVWVYSLHVEALALRGSVERMAEAIRVQDVALRQHAASIQGLSGMAHYHFQGSQLKYEPSNN